MTTQYNRPARSNPAETARDGPGQHAHTPRALSFSEWWAVIKRVFRAIGDDNLSITAAGVSFFALLALFPAIGAFVALYGLMLDPQAVVQQLSQLSGIVPSDVLDTLTGQMRQLAAGSGAKLTIAAVVSLLVALWGARMGTNALISALNIAYGEHEQRGLIRLTLFSLLLTLAIILGLICIALLAIGVPFVFAALGAGGWVLAIGRALGIALAAVLLVFGLAGLYRWAPDRRAPRWPWVFVGALVVMLFWVLGSILFSIYLGISDRYSATYGSLGSVIILLTWLYMTAFIMLVGGELNAQLEQQMTADTTVDAARPMGERGAVAADHWAPQHDQDRDHDGDPNGESG